MCPGKSAWIFAEWQLPLAKSLEGTSSQGCRVLYRARPSLHIGCKSKRPSRFEKELTALNPTVASWMF